MKRLRKFQSDLSSDLQSESGFCINFASPPQPNSHHASSSNHQVQVTIEVEHNSTPPPATADDRPWDPTLASTDDMNKLKLEGTITTLFQI